MKKLTVLLFCLLVSSALFANNDLDAIIAARLAKIELMIKGGDTNTAMGLLENLSQSYPETTAFHERAMELALSCGAQAMANRVAHECLQRDPENRKAKAVLAKIHSDVLKRSHHVTDVDTFTRIARLIETNKRCSKLTRACLKARHRGKDVGPLTKSNWWHKVNRLYKSGFLSHPIPCPLPDGSFQSTEKGQIECPQAMGLTLGLSQKKPVIEKKTLIEALRSSCPVTRAHSRQLLLEAKGANYILSSIANHCISNLSSYDQRELLLSLIKVLKSTKKARADDKAMTDGNTPIANGSKEGRQFIASYCSSVSQSPFRDIRQLAAHVHFLAMDDVGLSQLKDLKELLDKDAYLPPAKDIDYLTALVKTNREFTRILYRALRDGKHRLNKEIIIRSFAWCHNPKVISYLIKCLSGPTDSLTFLALIETLQRATGEKFGDPKEWQSWWEKKK